jgi:putative tryptophan/tyrosine transport system permease protein
LDWIGILETAGQQGFILGLVSLSVALSFRVLDFPDLTVDGSFAFGGAITATMIAAGFNPLLATIAAIFFGAMSGALTGVLNAKMRISRILAGILVMTMLYTVNLRVMGRPNVSLLNSTTVLSPIEKLDWPRHLALICFYFVLVIMVKLLLDLLFRTNYGLLTVSYR